MLLWSMNKYANLVDHKVKVVWPVQNAAGVDFYAMNVFFGLNINIFYAMEHLCESLKKTIFQQKSSCAFIENDFCHPVN